MRSAWLGGIDDPQHERAEVFMTTLKFLVAALLTAIALFLAWPQNTIGGMEHLKISTGPP
jgi:hypothetical protein